MRLIVACLSMGMCEDAGTKNVLFVCCSCASLARSPSHNKDHISWKVAKGEVKPQGTVKSWAVNSWCTPKLPYSQRDLSNRANPR